MLDSRRELIKQIASERIRVLFELAEKSVKDEPGLSHRYVASLRKISTHYKVKVPKKLGNQICTKCNLVLSPGITSTVRIASSKGYVVYKCNSCGKETHIRY